eukprot:gene25868-34457_t
MIIPSERARRLDWLIPQWLEDVDAYSQSIDEDMISVYYTIVVNLIICILCVLFFSFFRRYAPEDLKNRLYSPKIDIVPHKTPPRLRTDSLFGWVYDIYSIDDEVIIEKGGYDVMSIIRFGTTSMVHNSFDRWSMTNIPQQSAKCWLHLMGIYILSFITIFFLEKEFVVYAKYRHKFLRQTHAHLRTVLVEGIPNKMRSTVTLATYFEALYPNSVLHVRLGQNLAFLDRLVDQRESVVAQLERYLYVNNFGFERPRVKVGNMLDSVDAIRYYSQTLDDLNKLISTEQAVARRLATYSRPRAIIASSSSSSSSGAFSSSTGSSKLSGKVLDEFLKVTEMDAAKKLLSVKTTASSPSSKKKAESPRAAGNAGSNSSGKGGDSSPHKTASTALDESDSFFNSYQNNPLQNSNSSSRESEEDGFEEEEEEGGPRIRPFRLYRMTWAEWGWTMWTSPSLADCWRIFRDFRYAEDHTSNDGTGRKVGDANDESDPSREDEEASLISPPEERRMFLSKAFVTFKTFTAATTARQVVHMQLAGRMAVSEAPEPSDIIWQNMYTTRKGTMLRRAIVEVLVMFLIISWVAPVTLLSFIFSKESLSGFFPWLAQPLVLVGIMNLLPPILNFLGVIQGCISFSSNQFQSFDRYFSFQIINVFLVTTIAGSVIDCVKDIYSDPSSTFRLLGSSLPKMGGFFMNYMLVKAFTGLGIELIRLGLKQLFTSNVTPRDKRAIPFFGALRNIDVPGWFPSAKIYAQDMLLFVVSATYSCIAPLTLLAGLCYFAGASLVYTHQLLFIYVPICETGGKWWPKMDHEHGTMDVDSDKVDLLGADDFAQPSLRAETVQPDLEFPFPENKTSDFVAL